MHFTLRLLALASISLAISNSTSAISKSYKIDNPSFLGTGMVTFDDVADGRNFYSFDFVMGSNSDGDWLLSNSLFFYNSATGSATIQIATQNETRGLGERLGTGLGVFDAFESFDPVTAKTVPDSGSTALLTVGGLLGLMAYRQSFKV